MERWQADPFIWRWPAEGDLAAPPIREEDRATAPPIALVPVRKEENPSQPRIFKGMNRLLGRIQACQQSVDIRI